MFALDTFFSEIPVLTVVAIPVALFLIVLLFRAFRRPAQTRIILDASNVMYWKDQKPKIETVREVLRYLRQHNLSPGVIFDANAGYILTGRHQNDAAFARILRLRQDQVIVVNRGTPADPVILNAARELRARIITNDRYRDWVDGYPEILVAGHLVRGGYQSGRLHLDLE